MVQIALALNIPHVRNFVGDLRIPRRSKPLAAFGFGGRAVCGFTGWRDCEPVDR